jgi:vanillate/3-O-methylgallate O-demethylase
MAYQCLEDILRAEGSILPTLRHSKAGMYLYPGVAPEFSNWRDEQRAWRETAVLFDQSHHMHEAIIEGPDAFDFLQGLAVNSFANFDTHRAKQFIAVNPEGYFIGDMVAFREQPQQFILVGREVIANWVEFNASQSGMNVRVRRDHRSPARPDGKAILRSRYRFQIQGPQAPAIFEKLHGGPIPQIPFFQIGLINIGTRTVRALRHGMAGAPGLELWGPYDDKHYIRDTILNAAASLGIDLRQVGSRAYPTKTLESGWIPNPLPAVYSGGGLMQRYREWLPVDSYEASGALGGSFETSDVQDYYVTPYDMGYGNFIKFDHDFIGRDALAAMKDRKHRRKVTFEWNGDDVAKILASAFQREALPYKWIELPWVSYAATTVDRVMQGDRVAGLSLFTGYSYNERCVLSLGMVDDDIKTGDILELVWGEPDGGQGLASVEAHRQTTVRVRVSAVPYSRAARESYAEGWRTTRAA